MRAIHILLDENVSPINTRINIWTSGLRPLAVGRFMHPQFWASSKYYFVPLLSIPYSSFARNAPQNSLIILYGINPRFGWIWLIHLNKSCKALPHKTLLFPRFISVRRDPTDATQPLPPCPRFLLGCSHSKRPRPFLNPTQRWNRWKRNYILEINLLKIAQTNIFRPFLF